MTTRRLAAILAADVVGFSSMMEKDEEGTLERIKKLQREVIEPKVKERGGRLVKTTGDGFLCEFGSPVEAVRCALEVRNAACNGASESLLLRIGINLGDIIIEPDGDIYGDGVNLATRLEQIAAPGGICVSGSVHDHAEGKVPVSFENLGEQQVKNIARPVRVYSLGGAPQAKNEPKPLPLPDKPSIAVLPFTNMSGDSEQEFFADGLVEEITTALGRIRWLFVIARASSFIYKQSAADVRQVGQELGVRYVLGGSVRKSGRRVRIAAHLIDAPSGAQLWADRYERDVSDVFEMQDEITNSVAAILEPTVVHAEQQRTLSRQPENLDAWETYQRGLWHFYKYTADDNRTAQTLFRRANEIDPNFAPGHYGIALAHHLDFWLYPGKPWAEVSGTALKEAQIAVSLDDQDAMAHAILSFAQQLCGQWESAIKEGRTSVLLNPNSAWSIGALGHALGWGGYPTEGMSHLRRAMRLSPHDPLTWLWTFWIGIFQYLSGDYDAASETMAEVIRLRQGHLGIFFAQRWLAAALGQLGRTAEAKDALEKAITVSPELFKLFAHHRPPWNRPEDYAHVVDGLRKAGWRD